MGIATAPWSRGRGSTAWTSKVSGRMLQCVPRRARSEQRQSGVSGLLIAPVVVVALQQRAPVGVVLHPVHSAAADARSRLTAALLHPAFRALHHALGKVALVHGDEVIVDLTLVVVRHVPLLVPGSCILGMSPAEEKAFIIEGPLLRRAATRLHKGR